jgi:hypothetical protein
MPRHLLESRFDFRYKNRALKSYSPKKPHRMKAQRRFQDFPDRHQGWSDLNL